MSCRRAPESPSPGLATAIWSVLLATPIIVPLLLLRFRSFALGVVFGTLLAGIDIYLISKTLDLLLRRSRLRRRLLIIALSCVRLALVGLGLYLVVRCWPTSLLGFALGVALALAALIMAVMQPWRRSLVEG